MMKIAFYTNIILEYGGGYEKFLIETARNLTNFYTDIEIDIITMDDKFSKKINFFHTIYYFKRNKKSILYKESLSDIKRKLGKVNYFKIDSFKNLKNKLNKYDIVYSKNEILAVFIFKFFIGYKNLPPVIISCGTTIYHQFNKSIQSKLHNFMYNGFIYKFLAKGVKMIQVKNSLDERKIKLLFPNKRILKIYNSFNVSIFLKKSNRYIYNHEWDKSKTNILWIGRLTEQKGVDNLIEIINNINSSHYKKRIIWNIVGDGEERNKILKLLKKWDNIKYFGHINNDYIANVIINNNLFINTSIWEGCPNVILEVQALNLPVIAYNIPGVNDIINNKKIGILIKNTNEFIVVIKNFINNTYNFQNISNHIVEAFNPNKIYHQLFSMFKKISKNNEKRNNI